MNDKKDVKPTSSNYPSNKDFEGDDKAPGEEKGIGEQVTTNDLKGKKVDADPDVPFEQPIRQLP